MLRSPPDLQRLCCEALHPGLRYAVPVLLRRWTCAVPGV